jgi:hypothetical protein
MALRAVAARALGDLGGPGPVDFLEVLLGDPDHKVSTNAGQAMCRIGAAGLARLRQVADRPGDAGDCAREAIAIHALSRGLTSGPSTPLATVPPASPASADASAPRVSDAEVAVQ